jgi:hypothetical protein
MAEHAAPTDRDAHWAFHPHPKRDVVFRLPLVTRLISAVGTVIMAGMTLGITGFAIVAAWKFGWGISLFIGLTACFMAALTAYVGKDLRGKWGLRVVLEPDALLLDLPEGRSLIHRPSALHARIPYSAIAAIETRQEVYVSQVMAMMQRAYVLHRKSGELIFLFEDRAVGSQLEVNYFAKLVAEIVARSRAPLRDLGMAEGKGGILGVWGTHEPDWAAPVLSYARRKQLLRRVAITGMLPIPLVIVALAVRLLLGG